MKKKLQHTNKQSLLSDTIFSSLPNLPTINQMVECLINEALLRTNNLTEASRLLGISRQTLHKRIHLA